MAESDHKSSEDLIREANERLRGPATHIEPIGENASSAPPASPSVDPLEDPSAEPQHIEYRSQQLRTPVDMSDSGTETWPSGPIEPQPERGLRISGAVPRLVIAALVFGGWFLFTSLDDASRDDSGEIASGGDLDVMSLQVGDCFNDPEELEDVVYDVAAVPCSEPHDNEVFALQTVDSSLGDTYPEEETLDQHSHQMCSGSLFDMYVGTAYVDSSLEVFTLTPSQDSWDEGDREIVCALYRLDFGKLTGSARDSGL